MTVFSGDSASWHKKYLDLNPTSNKGFKNFVLKEIGQQKRQAGPT